MTLDEFRAVVKASVPDNTELLEAELISSISKFKEYLNSIDKVNFVDAEMQQEWNFVNSALLAFPQQRRTLSIIANGDIDRWIDRQYAEVTQCGGTLTRDGRYLVFKFTEDRPFTLDQPDGPSADFDGFKCTVRIRHGDGFLFNNVECTPLSGDSFVNDDGFFHPHVNSSGSLCLGDLSNPIHGLCSTLEFTALRQSITAVMHTYNGNSPYCDLRFFVRGTCEVCGAESSRLETCENCGSVHCPNCHLAPNCTKCSTRCDSCTASTPRKNLSLVKYFEILDDSIAPSDDKYVCSTCHPTFAERMENRRKAMEAIAALEDSPAEDVPQPTSQNSIVEVPLDVERIT